MDFNEGDRLQLGDLTIARYHELMQAADVQIRKILPGQPTKQDVIEALDLQDETIELVQTLKIVEAEYGFERLDSFKKELVRIQTCWVRHGTMKNPITGEPTHNTCKSRSCRRCGPYQGTIRLHYHDNICRIAIVDDISTATIITQEIKDWCKSESPWLVVTNTPLDSGKVVVRISNLRSDEANILLDHNEVHQSLKDIDELFGLEPVIKISQPKATGVMYQTSSGVQFTTTELYQARPEGKTGKREGGDLRGYQFNSDSGEVEYVTLKEIKEIKDKDLEGTMNVPGIKLDGVTKDESRSVIRNVIERHTVFKNKIAFQIDSFDDFKELTITIAKEIIEEFDKRGFNKFTFQTYENVRVTKDEYAEFISKYATRPTKQEINEENLYEDENLETPSDIHSVVGKYRFIMKRRIQDNKVKIRNTISLDEAVENLLDQLF